MPPRAEDLEQIVLAIRRLLDAELLLQEEADPLLAGAEAACCHLAAGDEGEARSLLEQLARDGAALAQTGLLDWSSSYAIVDAVRQAIGPDSEPPSG